MNILDYKNKLNYQFLNTKCLLDIDVQFYIHLFNHDNLLC